MTAGHNSHALRLWAVGGISDLKDDDEDSYSGGSVNRARRRNNHQGKQSGLTMEDEMTLDGAVTCAQFDDMLDMVKLSTSISIFCCKAATSSKIQYYPLFSLISVNGLYMIMLKVSTCLRLSLYHALHGQLFHLFPCHTDFTQYLSFPH